MIQKRSLGPHNSNPASEADHLNVSGDRNLRPESPKKLRAKISPNRKIEIEIFENHEK